MTTFADAHAATTAARIKPRRPQAPSGFEPGVRYEAGVPAEVVVQLDTGQTVVPEDEQAWRDDITRTTGLVIPDNRRVEVAQVRYWGEPSSPQVYVRFTITDRETDRPAEDLAELLAVARANPRPRARRTKTGRTRVVVISDVQIGKVDARGGTPALLARLTDLFGQLDDEMRRVPCDDAVLLDPGDLLEGFENTGAQAFTNDLSFPEQLRYGRTILTEAVTRVAARHARTRVATVGSNHTAWRRGKDNLGRPGDDFGIETHRAVADALAYAGRRDVSFILPETWSDSLALQVRGAVIGLTHGHKVSNPDRFPDWWAKQTHGGGPLASATICVSGHFHHLRVQPTGQVDGRSRWWFQAPTLDGGSSWFANAGGGSDSEPGLLTFTVDDDGRWHDLEVLHVRPPAAELDDAAEGVVALRAVA